MLDGVFVGITLPASHLMVQYSLWISERGLFHALEALIEVPYLLTMLILIIIYKSEVDSIAFLS